MDTKMVDDAFIAGLLHDVGKIIMAAQMREKCKRIEALIEQDNMTRLRAEKAVAGTTHAEIGAYLLGLWGFSDSIVEAVAFHHEPIVELHSGFSILAIVHVVNALVNEITNGEINKDIETFNTEYISSLDLEDKIPEWRETCSEIISQEEE